MKELPTQLADYNREVNRNMYSSLQDCGDKILNESSGSYFENIMGLINHILLADLHWLKTWRDSDLDLPILKNSPALDFTHPGWKNLLYSDFSDLKIKRAEVDDLFVKFTESLDEEILNSKLQVTRSNGEIRTYLFGKIILHVFNHQTHHRGSVAQILDERGIENDYSNLSNIILLNQN